MNNITIRWIISAMLIPVLIIMTALAAERADLSPGNGSWMETAGFGEALVTPEEISPGDTVLDISPNASQFIDGAVSLNYQAFLDEGGALQPVSEIARLLGDAGIKSNDSLLITGECMPCGGGPAPAFFTYWLLRYLGHEDVRVLQGDAVDWKAAGLNISSKPAVKPRADYVPHIQAGLLATYEFVAEGGAQIVDARPLRDYEIGSIPRAINIPYEDVLVNGSLDDEQQLGEVFSGLQKAEAVVVYTNVGIEAAIEWFALKGLGYDARLYSWRDWLVNQPKFGYELEEVGAEPNPARPGQSVSITAVFLERKAGSVGSPSDSSGSMNSGDDKLTIKGCATCGFGSPQGFANLDRKDGFVQIGSAGRSPPSAGTEGQKEDGTLRCTAIIVAPDGSEAARMSLLHTVGGKFMGIWNAESEPGIYKTSIVASASKNSETFADVLEIEVVA